MPCDDEDAAFVKWDYNMNPVTVADENEEYGYDPDQPFARVVFVPFLDRECPNWQDNGLDAIREGIATEAIRESAVYKYPVARLRITGTQF
jgi:hypothetical protein